MILSIFLFDILTSSLSYSLEVKILDIPKLEIIVLISNFPIDYLSILDLTSLSSSIKPKIILKVPSVLLIYMPISSLRVSTIIVSLREVPIKET